MTQTIRLVVLAFVLSTAAACVRGQQTPTGPTSVASPTATPAPTPSPSATEIFNCPKTADDASDLARTLYVASYPGATLGEVDLGFTAKDTPGSYSVQLTVFVNGAAAGTSTVSISVPSPRQRAAATFTFAPAVSVPSGSSVRLSAVRVSGPGELSYEGQADSSCGVIVTSGAGSTTPVVGPKLPVRIVN